KYARWEPLLVLGPSIARVIADDGWSKDDLRGYLHEHVTITRAPGRDVRAAGRRDVLHAASAREGGRAARGIRDLERSRASGAGVRAARQDRHPDRRRSRPQPVQGLRQQPHPGRTREQEGGRVSARWALALALAAGVAEAADPQPPHSAAAEVRCGDRTLPACTQQRLAA